MCFDTEREGWLDKTRVEIVALDCSESPQQQFGLKFGSVKVICVDSMRIQTGSSVKGP